MLVALASPALAQIGGPIDLGDLPAGKKVRVHFDVTVDSPLGPLVMQVENQGTVASSSMAFGPLPTDDPADGTSEADPTVTPLDGLTIGNQVWKDDDGDMLFGGIGGPGPDSPLPLVKVNLYLDDGTTAGLLDAGDTLLLDTLTDPGGMYFFTGLQPGDYIVEIDPCNFTGVGCPALLAALATITDPAPDPDDDVDDDDNGESLLPTFGVAAKAVTLTFGGETLGDEDGDGDTDTNLTVDFGFAEVVDLEIDKSDDGTDAVAGATYDYTIKITNLGPGASTGSTVTDTLPSGWTFDSSTGACVGDGGSPVETVTCTVGPIPPAGMASFDITAMVPSDAPAGTVTNSASVAGAQSDPMPGNNSDSEMTDVVRRADLEITSKTDAPDPVAAGADLTYTISYTNNGPSDASSVEVADVLPPNTTFVSANLPAGWGSIEPPPGGTGTVTYLRTTSPAGETTVFTIVVKVDSSVAGGATIDNTATASSATFDPGPAPDSAMSSTTVVLETDLELDKSDDGTNANAGTNYDYDLKVTNNGPSDSTGGSVSDTLPTGWAFVSATGGTCVGTASGFDCTVDPLTAGAMQTITATVSVPASATAGTVTNSATVTANETDPTGANDSDDEMTTVVPSTDLEIDKSDDGTDAVAGETYDYTIKVTNNGPADSTGGTVTDTLPAGWSYVSAIGGTCAAAAGGFTCTVDPLTLGSMQTFTVTVMVPSTAAETTVTNTASVAANESDLVSGNDSDDEMTTVVRETDLEMDKSDDGTDAVAGTTYVYTLKVTNNGPSLSAGVTVVDTLPLGWTYFSGPASCSGDGGNPETVTCTLPGTTGGMTTVMITVMVPASAVAGVVTNTATVSSTTTDPVPGNNSDNEMTTVVRDADLEMDKSDDGSDAVAGDTYVYTLKVTNNGPSDSAGGTVTDTLPADWTFVSSTNGTCAGDLGNPETVTCSVGALTVGAMESFTITVAVPADHAIATASNTADVTGDDPDSVPGNDSDTEPTDVVREADLVVTKTESVDPVLAGVGLPGNLTYVVTVENLGPSDVTGVSIDEDITLPAPDVTVDSVTPSAGSFTPTVAPDGTWDGFDLAAGASETLTVVISVGPSAPFGTDIISNTATLTGTTGGETLINTGDDSATESTSILVDLDFGDAPDPTYPTLSMSDGARHAIVPGGPVLGSLVDDDSDGQPTAGADGDDLDGGDDEDGVVFGAIVAGASVDVDVTVSGSAGLLNAWVDFDADGVFAPGEKVFADEPVALGLNSLTFAVPADVAGPTFARFRLSTDAGLLPTGIAPDGEVEDYAIEMTRETDLELEKKATFSPILRGKIQVYTLKVTNNGPSNASGVTVEDTLPAGLDFASGTEELADPCTEAAGVVTCDVGDLDAGESANLWIAGLVRHDAASPLVNSATVSGDDPDPDAANNDASTSSDVRAFRKAITLADVNGNGSAEIAYVEAGSVVVGVRDALTKALIKKFNRQPEKQPVDMVALDDTGGTPAPELAILTRDLTGDQPQVLIYDAVSGVKLRSIVMDGGDASGIPVEPLMVRQAPDFGGDPGPEVAVLERAEDGRIVVVIKDAISQVLHSKFSVDLGSPVRSFPVGMQVMDNFAGTPAPEIAILVADQTGKTRVIVHDGLSGAKISDRELRPFRNLLVPLDLDQTPDLGAVPGPETVTLGFRGSNAAVWGMIHDLGSGFEESRTAFGAFFKPYALRVGADNLLPGGGNEMFMMGRRDNGAVGLFIGDTATGIRGPGISYDSAGGRELLGLDVVEIDDLDGLGDNELGVLLIDVIGPELPRLKIKDGVTRTTIHNSLRVP